MRELAMLLAGAAFACGAMGQTVIYDTLNEDDQSILFDCCNTVPIVVRPVKDRAYVAVPFTPTVRGRISEVDVALSNFGNPAAAPQIEIYGSANGLPGDEKEKHHFTIRGVPQGGQCCQFMFGAGAHVLVQAGDQYWIVVQDTSRGTPNNFSGGWNLNTLGLQGPYAIRSAHQDWQWTSGTLPAVRIFAR